MTEPRSDDASYFLDIGDHLIEACVSDVSFPSPGGSEVEVGVTGKCLTLPKKIIHDNFSY